MLDFSDKSFAEFFASEAGVDIDDPRYARYGGSKGKRLRAFLQERDDSEAVQILRALWDHRSEYLARQALSDPSVNAEARFRALVRRLSGEAAPQAAAGIPQPPNFSVIKTDLLQISSLPPQARGYAFEGFLKRLFDAFGLKPRDPFRLHGEQIDGGFQLGSDVYLLEAKWHGSPTGAADLHVFHGKLEQKAVWARGLFVSSSGFSEEGLVAFGRGKRIICMDGRDLDEMLERELPLPQVLEGKVRRAAETGSPFARIRDLFPR